jgi:hypothetical protein
MRAVALYYARAGWRVFPLRPRQKIPLTEHGCHDATTDLEQIGAWWQRWPQANVGIATGAESGLLVVDIDGEEGELALAELVAQHGSMPVVPEVTTGRGRHLYFAYDERVKNSAKKLPKIDTRSTGGYVVAPPSIHPDGRVYTWAAGASPRERTVAPAPEWLIELFAPKKASPGAGAGAYKPPPAVATSDLDGTSARYRAWFMHALEGEARELASTREGSRGSAANRAAYKLAGYLPNLLHGIATERDIELELLAACVANGVVAKDGVEKVRATIRRGLEAGRSSPRDVPQLEDRPDSRVARPAPPGRNARPTESMPVDDGAGDAPPPSDDDYIGPGGPSREELPVIFDTFDENEMARLADRYFADDPELYQRGGLLVQVLVDSSPGAGVVRSHQQPRIVVLEADWLRAISTRCVRWMKRRLKDGEVETFEIKPPRHAIAAFKSRRHWDHVRKLEGVTTTPLFRVDGEILSRPGYDTTTGMLLAPHDRFDALPSQPTKQDVDDAIEALRYVVTDFPFESPAHEATFFAAILTPLARTAFRGPSPLFMLDANTPGTGKGLLAKVIGLISIGSAPRLIVTSRDESEERKLITTVAMDGDQLVCVDNIEGKWGSPAMCVALTTDEWSDRVLGGSTTYKGPLLTTWLATANNVVLTTDMIRRVAHIRLVTRDERPEERTGFQIPELEAYVRQNRPRLVRAALTILRGWHVAGRPKAALASWGSYEGWSSVVRQALVWAGLADPADTRASLRDASDSSTDQLAELIRALVDVYTGAHLTAGEILAKAKDDSGRPLREALEAYTGGRTPLNAKSIGRLLIKVRGRIVDGRRIAGAKPSPSAQWAWWVEDTNGKEVISNLEF